MPDHLITRMVISQRGKWWARQSIEAKAECWERARRYQHQRADKVRKEMAELSDQVDKLLAQEEKDNEVYPPVCLSISAVDSSDLEAMADKLKSPEFCSVSRLAMLRADLLIVPPAPVMPELPEGTALWSYSEPEQPDWAKQVALYRDFFRDAAFVFCVDGIATFWKFVYAVQKPHSYVAMCELLPTNFSDDGLPGSTATSFIPSFPFDYAFRCNYGILKTAADMPVLSVDDLSVVFNVWHVGGVVVTARGPPQPLRAFLAGEHITESHSLPKEKKDPKVDQEFETLVLQYPWLEHLSTVESFVARAQTASSSKDRTPKSDLNKEHEIDEDEIFAALARVELARVAEADIAAARGTVDFVCIENRGESNVLKGKAFHDAVQGKCAHKEADTWARGHRLQVTYKATFTEHKEVPSRILVRSWVHRMQHFYDYELKHGCDGFKFTQAMVDLYVEPDELTNLASSCTHAHTLQRIAVLRKIPLK